MFFKDNKYKNLITAVIITIVVALLAFKLIDNIGIFIGIIGKIISLSMPFIYGIVIAYALNPIVKFLQKKTKFTRAGAIAVTYAILIGVVVIIAIYGIPALVNNIKEFGSNIPNYIRSIEGVVDTILERDEMRNFISSTGVIANVDMYINKMGELAMTALEGSLMKMVSFSSILVKVVLGLLVAIYILIDKERLTLEMKKLLFLIAKEQKATKIIEFIKTYNSMIGTYIGIKAIDSSIIGLMAFVLLNIVGSEYSVMLSIVVAITNMIPYFGPFVGEVVGFLINVFISPTKGLIVFLTLFSLQMFDGWYLDPKLIGNKVGVRPFWIIYAVVIGGGFFGPIGMLLASPTAATIKIYYDKLIRNNVSIPTE